MKSNPFYFAVFLDILLPALVLFVCFLALSTKVQAVNPTPQGSVAVALNGDGGYAFLKTDSNGNLQVSTGFPCVVKYGRSVGQIAANPSVVTYTVDSQDASFQVSANVLVTTSTLHNFTVTCSYTDEGNTARVLTLNFAVVAGTLGTTIVNTAGAVPYQGVPMHIRCKGGTTITVATTGTFTTVVYNVEGAIEQLQ